MTVWFSVNQFCPKGFKNGKTALKGAINGSDEDNRVEMSHEKDCALFTMWIKDIGNHLEEYVMDTSFKIPHDINFRV